MTSSLAPPAFRPSPATAVPGDPGYDAARRVEDDTVDRGRR